jgi:hypothetical protein
MDALDPVPTPWAPLCQGFPTCRVGATVVLPQGPLLQGPLPRGPLPLGPINPSGLSALTGFDE